MNIPYITEQISDLTCHKISPNIDKPNNSSFLDEGLQISNRPMLVSIISIIAAGLFTMTILTHTNNNVFAKNYNPKTEEQVNNCGNNALSGNITCVNLGPNTEIQKNINNMTIMRYSHLPFP
jgi:hypothetical protein